MFTDCAIYFRAKPFFEKKDRVSYEQLKKREPQSKMSTGNVIFADTRLAMMPYLVVEKRDVLELLVAIRKRLIERSK